MDCPKCGKPMVEERRFPGLWLCPDYKTPVNERAPFRFKCKGMKLTEAGAEAFEQEFERQHILRLN